MFRHGQQRRATLAEPIRRRGFQGRRAGLRSEGRSRTRCDLPAGGPLGATHQEALESGGLHRPRVVAQNEIETAALAKAGGESHGLVIAGAALVLGRERRGENRNAGLQAGAVPQLVGGGELTKTARDGMLGGDGLHREPVCGAVAGLAQFPRATDELLVFGPVVMGGAAGVDNDEALALADELQEGAPGRLGPVGVGG